MAPKVWHEKHQHFLSCKRNLAKIYRLLGRLRDAEEMLLPLIESYKASFGGYSRISTLAMAELAATYFHQKRFHESLILAQRVLNTRKSILGEHHYGILANQRLIGRIFHAQGNLKQAQQTMSGTLKQMEQFWGKNHPNTLHTARLLAW
jgi:hypothetical protein